MPAKKSAKKSTSTVKSSKSTTKSTGDKTKGAAAGKARTSLATERPYLTPTTVAHHDDLSPEQQEAHRSTFGSQDIAVADMADAPGGDPRNSPSTERSRAALRTELEGSRAQKKEAAKAKPKEEPDAEETALEENLDAADEEAEKSKKRTEKVRKSGEQPNDPNED